MPLITANGKRLFFAHVPKTGGSSVEEYLIRRFGGPLSLRDKTHWAQDRKRGLIALSTHFTARDLDDVLPHDVDHLFAVVRDPLKRMQSQFRFQEGVSRTRSLNFSSWLRVMFKACEIDPRVYQNHIRPQSDLVREGSEVFKLEDKFDDMIAWLSEVTGTEAPEDGVGHFLKKKHEPIKMTRQDVKLITDFYAVDYDRFGYERPDPQEHPNILYPGWKQPMVTALAYGIVKKQHRHWLR